MCVCVVNILFVFVSVLVFFVIVCLYKTNHFYEHKHN